MKRQEKPPCDSWDWIKLYGGREGMDVACCTLCGVNLVGRDTNIPIGYRNSWPAGSNAIINTHLSSEGHRQQWELHRLAGE